MKISVYLQLLFCFFFKSLFASSPSPPLPSPLSSPQFISDTVHVQRKAVRELEGLGCFALIQRVAVIIVREGTGGKDEEEKREEGRVEERR